MQASNRSTWRIPNRSSPLLGLTVRETSQIKRANANPLPGATAASSRSGWPSPSVDSIKRCKAYMTSPNVAASLTSRGVQNTFYITEAEQRRTLAIVANYTTPIIGVRRRRLMNHKQLHPESASPGYRNRPPNIHSLRFYLQTRRRQTFCLSFCILGPISFDDGREIHVISSMYKYPV